MSMHYVVVADAARARVFSADATLADLREIVDLVHPASRAHTRELVTDDRGRTQAGPGMSHSGTEGADAHHEEAKHFARDVAHHLHDAWHQHRFERLIVVAAPRFLGLLRDVLDKNLARATVAEIAKDLTHTPVHELPATLRRLLPEDAGLPDA